MSSDKGKFGKWLKKAITKVPALANAGIKLASGNIVGAFEEVKNTLQSTPTDAAKQLSEEFEMFELEWKREVFEMEVDDRKHARESGDKRLQRVVAYFSLIGFTVFGLIQMWLMYQVMVNNVEVNEFAITTVSYIQGIFTALLFTLKDFLYGGSLKENNQ